MTVLNFLKSKNSADKIIKSKLAENEIIKQVHNEFDTAQDRLLFQAKELLTKTKAKVASNQNIEATGSRLKNIGFINTPIAKQYDNILLEKRQIELLKVETESDATAIEMYKSTYPFLKFLTVNELNRICDKYGLIYAPVSNYIENVPEKNLKMIEDAQPLNETDQEETKYFIEIRKFYHTCPDDIKNILKGRVEIKYNPYCVPHDFEPSETDLMKLIHDKGYQGSYTGYIYSNASIIVEDYKGLFICAPKSHFNLDGLSQNGIYGFLNVMKYDIKDPIVFRYCKGGIQVLSKWGLEASDDALLNPIEN